ncbi:MAG TPA: hypothetical protein VF173_20910 [Thermoanaerobaculia bacterium]|nr:hypothetical protein [Thermoanaerobaculia bacterium]
MEIRATGAAYLFESLFYSAAAAGRTALIVLLSIMASLLIKSVYDMWRDGDKPKEWIRSYTTKASLIDLDGGLYPLHGRHSGNFNAATVAPELRGTYNVSQKAMDSFQKSIPGSFGSREVLRTIREQCEGYLRRVVLDGRSQEFGIEIFSGTSRALEVALERAGKASFIIVSPFEHPAERAVVEWCAPIIGSGVWYMDVMESIVDQPWQKSRERFVSEMREQIVQALSKKSMPLLLISEVWWANGLLIPLAEIVQPLREEFGSALRIVVDGAHVPGNLSGPEGISVADAYVMSAHKWLLSSEPCGILLSKSSHIERQPYDAWLEELPVSTVSFRSIASLRGALVQLESVQLSYLRRRSESLKNFFLARLGDRFKVVGRESGLPSSLMVAIEPALGLRWQFDRVGLERYFADRGVSVAVVPFVRGRVWVRIAFPYFLEAGDVINLCRTLRGAVTFSG